MYACSTDLQVEDKDGKSSFEMACDFGDTEIVNWILNRSLGTIS